MLLAEYGQVDDRTYESDEEGNGHPLAGRDILFEVAILKIEPVQVH